MDFLKANNNLWNCIRYASYKRKTTFINTKKSNYDYNFDTNKRDQNNRSYHYNYLKTTPNFLEDKNDINSTYNYTEMPNSRKDITVDRKMAHHHILTEQKDHIDANKYQKKTLNEYHIQKQPKLIEKSLKRNIYDNSSHKKSRQFISPKPKDIRFSNEDELFRYVFDCYHGNIDANSSHKKSHQFISPKPKDIYFSNEDEILKRASMSSKLFE